MNIPQLEKFPDYGDLMPLTEWLQGVRSNFFIDEDGYGYWATKDGFDPDERVMPSEVYAGHQPAPRGATHVLWFNR